jgi:hypothetical protein
VLGTSGSVLEPSNSYMLSGICILLIESNSSVVHERLQVWTLVILLQAGVLVTPGGCHLLDVLEVCGLQVARLELVRCSRGDHIVERCYARPAGDCKEQLVEARSEEHQVVRPDRSNRALVWAHLER